MIRIYDQYIKIAKTCKLFTFLFVRFGKKFKNGYLDTESLGGASELALIRIENKTRKNRIDFNKNKAFYLFYFRLKI